MAGESLVLANESFYKAWVDSVVEEGPHLLFSVFFFLNLKMFFLGWLNCSPTALVLIVWNLFVIFKVITCFPRAFINHKHARRTSGRAWKPGLFNLEVRRIFLRVPVTVGDLRQQRWLSEILMLSVPAYVSTRKIHFSQSDRSIVMQKLSPLYHPEDGLRDVCIPQPRLWGGRVLHAYVAGKGRDVLLMPCTADLWARGVSEAVRTCPPRFMRISWAACLPAR